MTDLQEKAMRVALKRLERSESELHKARAELRQALAQPEQEPEPRGHCTCGDPTLLGYVHFRTRPCIYYTAPYTKTDNPDRVLHKEWVGLTDAERFYCNEYPVDDCCSDSILRAEAKLKEKNT
jgi:hypothetical protein